MTKGNDALKPPQEVLDATLVDIRGADIQPDPFNGAPRRMERRQVFGHLVGEYRVSACVPATADDLVAGRAERMDPKDDESPLVSWKPVCQWQTITETQDMVAIYAMVDPCREIN